MNTLIWCWLALYASALFWVNAHPLLSAIFGAPAMLVLGFKLSKLGRERDWSDAGLLLRALAIFITAVIAAILMSAFRNWATPRF